MNNEDELHPIAARRSPMGEVLAALRRAQGNDPLKAGIVLRFDDTQVQRLVGAGGPDMVIPVTAKVRWDALDVKEHGFDVWELLVSTKEGNATVLSRLYVHGYDIAMVRVVTPLAIGGSLLSEKPGGG